MADIHKANAKRIFKINSKYRHSLTNNDKKRKSSALNYSPMSGGNFKIESNFPPMKANNASNSKANISLPGTAFSLKMPYTAPEKSNNTKNLVTARLHCFLLGRRS